MTTINSVDAIVIDMKPFRENSSVLEVITQEGYMTFVIYGKQSSKRDTPLKAFDRFSLITIQYSNKSRSQTNFIGATVKQCFSPKSEGLWEYAFLNWWLEIVRLVSIDPNTSREIYKLSEIAVRGVGDNKYLLGTLLKQLLRCCGFALDYDRCRTCRKSRTLVYLDISTGKSCCSKCAGEEPTLFPMTKKCNPVLMNGIARKNHLREMVIVTDTVFREHMGVRLVSTQFLLQAIS